MKRLSLRWPVLLVLFIALPFIFPGDFVRGLLNQFLIFSVLAVGMNVVFGYMGHIPFGYAAFWGLGAYGSALAALNLGWPFWVTFVMGAVIAAFSGLFIGWISLKLKGAYFAIATLGFMAILHVICKNWVSFTRGPMGLYGIPRPSLAGVPFDTNLSYYFLALAMLVFCLYFADRLDKSPVGRAISATRENEELSQSIGISVLRYQLVAFCVSSFMAGLAGSLYAHYFRSIVPDLMSPYYSLMAIAMVVVGGRGTLFGPLVGSLIFVVLPEYFGMTGPVRMLLFGLVTLACVIGLPKGAWPALQAAGGPLQGVIPNWAKDSKR
jgi:branched-chain amino acid transport system permease protein